jgi:NAD(P)-dependent dehydrogenase (short-subunit alcohol dehydrogenase family)
MDTGLDGKVAIVTGAAGGIGLACVHALAAEGARVVAGDLRPGAPGPAMDGVAWVAADVTKPDDAQRLVDEALQRFDRLDVLVAGAGVFDNTPFDRLDPERWDTVLAVNLRGVFLTAQAALGAMIPRRNGRIVLIASLGGQTGGLAASAAYASSKGGVITLTKSIARHAGPYGITVNCVAPGIIDSPMTANWPPETKEQLVAATPLDRTGTVDEVAAAVVFLASDQASFVHGIRLDVNGGLLMA